jgi:hypothetical protein
MSGVSGIKQRSAEHSPLPASAGQTARMGLPPVVVGFGVALEGWTAADWLNTVVWGVFVTVAFRLFSVLGKAMGLTQTNLPDLFGSTMTEPGTATSSRSLGAVIHHMG